jgi:PKD repeat protein
MAAPFFLDPPPPMKHRHGRAAALLLFALTVAWLARAAASPTVTFEVDPPNPVAGQTIRLRDTSPAAATSWSWDFGDGASASTAAPSHAWSEAGTYTVRLDAQDASAEKTITVSAETTLRLLAAHPFEISIDAKDPGDGSSSPAQAIAISDRFGWFSFPGLTNDPGNPEVTVKVLEAPTFGHYWIFWSAMTSLEYTMTVRDVVTNQVQVYAKTGSDPCGGWDLQSFPFQATPTPGGGGATPTPAPPTPTHNPNRTNTPTRTQTPTPTMTTTGAILPTATPTPTPGPTVITLRVLSYQWDWCAVDIPCQQGICPYEIGPKDPLGAGQNGITLHEGCTYKLIMYNADSVGEGHNHEMNGRPEIGVPDTVMAPGYVSSPPLDITIPTGGVTELPFNCKNTSCGNPSQHEGMTGIIHIAP